MTPIEKLQRQAKERRTREIIARFKEKHGAASKIFSPKTYAQEDVDKARAILHTLLEKQAESSVSSTEEVVEVNYEK